MNRIFSCFRSLFIRAGLLVALLLWAAPGRAQQGAPADSAAAAPAPPVAATDVIVRTNGDELPGRVLSITPTLIRYMPAAPAPPDTLELAATEVFMVRYANGTRELIRVARAEAPLVGLSTEQRYLRGRQDSHQFYQPAKGVFWGTFGATLAGYGYGGLLAGGVMALTPPRRQSLRASAPQPQLLDDPDYYRGYRKQAQNRKVGKAAAGFGTGVGVTVVVWTALLLALISTWH